MTRIELYREEIHREESTDRPIIDLDVGADGSLRLGVKICVHTSNKSRSASNSRHGHTRPVAPASPWQNGFAERLIGSIRRECLDHLVVLSEAHLRRILQAYIRYYNKISKH